MGKSWKYNNLNDLDFLEGIIIHQARMIIRLRAELTRATGVGNGVGPKRRTRRKKSRTDAH